ncbi:glutamate--cysteine ligase [Natronolimnobius sp. AArcel1]|uniref:glutamate--cysteine ligase n=1 Tax=Natronolimnobius sp. AArcel1 TaxID=1679093 RepID=UPI0013ED7EE9|nr:glutamate--cysteine ligase [Natronolimnobius sp. AArcel1]NGM68503.1 glutamate--cysteine ligase [Natronolimnobius sp. AArcel1]
MQLRLAADYWVVDRDGELVSATPLIDAAAQAGISHGPADALVTVKGPLESAPSAASSPIADRFSSVCATAATLDRRLVPLATPINNGPVSKHGQDASSTDSVPASAGARLRFDARNGCEQWNTLLALTPALALVSSAPYCRGNRVANSARAHGYRTHHGIPTGARAFEYIDSLADAASPANSSDPSDAAAIEWPIAFTPAADSRTNSSMLEWRLPDTALPSQLCRLAADLEAILERVARGHVHVGRYATSSSSVAAGSADDITVGHVTNAEVALPRAAIVSQLTETAIDIGLDATGVAAYLERMGFDIENYHPIASRIDGRQFVTQADARELRLEYAGRLEEDVQNLTSADVLE